MIRFATVVGTYAKIFSTMIWVIIDMLIMLVTSLIYENAEMIPEEPKESSLNELQLFNSDPITSMIDFVLKQFFREMLAKKAF